MSENRVIGLLTLFFLLFLGPFFWLHYQVREAMCGHSLHLYVRQRGGTLVCSNCGMPRDD